MIFAACITAAVTAPPTETLVVQSKLPKDGEEVGVLNTSEGNIIVCFYPDLAPNHVKQFKHLIKSKFYDGTRFHRCIDGFMIQGGDPNSKDLSKPDTWGYGGYVKDGKEVNLKQEFSDKSHKRGILSTARGGHSVDSASSQFFIMHKDYPALDKQYTVWGEVVSGMPVVDQIVKTGDKEKNGAVKPNEAVLIKSFRIQEWPIEWPKRSGGGGAPELPL